MKRILIAAAVAAALTGAARAEEIGSVDTEVSWTGPNHKIVIDGFDDPAVAGVGGSSFSAGA